MNAPGIIDSPQGGALDHIRHSLDSAGARELRHSLDQLQQNQKIVLAEKDREIVSLRKQLSQQQEQLSQPGEQLYQKQGQLLATEAELTRVKEQLSEKEMEILTLEQGGGLFRNVFSLYFADLLS